MNYEERIFNRLAAIKNDATARRNCAEIAAEADLEIARLQKALAFWLPGVPAVAGERGERISEDSFLLSGYEGEQEVDAESLGWIELVERGVAPQEAAPVRVPAPLLAKLSWAAHVFGGIEPPHFERDSYSRALNDLRSASYSLSEWYAMLSAAPQDPQAVRAPIVVPQKWVDAVRDAAFDEEGFTLDADLADLAEVFEEMFAMGPRIEDPQAEAPGAKP